MGKNKKKKSEPLKKLYEYIEIRKRLYPLATDKIIVYVRVSSEASAKSDLSIPEQVDRIKNFIKDDKELSKYVVNNEFTKDVIVIEDKAESGLDFENRPGLQEILDKIDNNSISHLLVYKVDRLGRSIKQNADTHEALKKKGVHIISVTESSIDTRENDCEFYFTLLSMFATMELNNIKERTMSANIRKMKQGYAPPGKPAFGFKRISSDKYNGNIFEPNKKEAKIVQEIFELAANGVTNANIIKLIYVKYNLLYTTSKLLRLIRNPIYKGVVRYGDYVKERALFDGIVTEEVWEKANTSRKTNIRNKDDQIYLKQHLFPDILKCPTCGSVLQCKNSKSTKGGQKMYYRYYVCKSSRKDNDIGKGEEIRNEKEYCSFKKIPAELLEAFIIWKFIEDVEKNNSYENIKKIQHLIFASMADFFGLLKNVDLKVKKGVLTKKVQTESTRLADLRDDYYKGKIDRNNYKKNEIFIENDIKDYKNQLDEVQKELDKELDKEEDKEIQYTIANKYKNEYKELKRLITFGYSLQLEKNKFRQFFKISINNLLDSIVITINTDKNSEKLTEKYNVEFQYKDVMPEFDNIDKGEVLSLSERIHSYLDVIQFVLDTYPDSKVSTAEQFEKKHNFQ